MSMKMMKCSAQSKVLPQQMCLAPVPCKPVSCKEQSSRRGLLGFFCGSIATLSLAKAPEALAYGGTKQLREMDAGSGNPDFEVLMKAVKQRRADAEAIAAGLPLPPREAPKVVVSTVKVIPTLKSKKKQ